jgi:ribosome biogenesis GTPase / thiamine phosphate phosphatase
MSRIDVDAFEDAWDDDVAVGPRGRPLASPAARAERRRQRAARVVAVDRGRIRVVPDGAADAALEAAADGAVDGGFDARYGGAMRGQRVVVGDRVRTSPARGDEQARLVERLERTSVLRRTGDDLDRHERVLVANADAAAVVVGADNLESGLRFADRVIVSATSGGLGTMLVVNKADLISDEAGEGVLRAALEPYARAVTTVLRVSATSGEGLDELRSVLAGRWTVFTGHSGVGKSSLTNALLPGVEQRTGEVGRRGGRHTTVASLALPLPGGGWLVDTPGVRSFGLGMLDRRGLAEGFPELVGLVCQLDDCVHAEEPGCALATVDLHPLRLATFRRLAAALDGERDPFLAVDEVVADDAHEDERDDDDERDEEDEHDGGR